MPTTSPHCPLTLPLPLLRSAAAGRMEAAFLGAQQLLAALRRPEAAGALVGAYAALVAAGAGVVAEAGGGRRAEREGDGEGEEVAGSGGGGGGTG